MTKLLWFIVGLLVINAGIQGNIGLTFGALLTPDFLVET